MTKSYGSRDAAEADRHQGVSGVSGPSYRGPVRRAVGRLRRLLRPRSPVVARPPAGLPPSRHEWAIGIYGGPTPIDLEPLPGVANPVLTRRDVHDRDAQFVADPFLLRYADSWYLFFEVLNRRTGRGEIGVATSADGAGWQYQGIVLAEDFHLSYPYVFAWRGSVYMVPESYQAGAVRLYEARRFPWQWRYVKCLVRGPMLADPSPFCHDGRWWLFVESDVRFNNDTLRLFGAPDIRGPWWEHPLSPVRTGDARLARPAGRVVADGIGLLRFAQDCEGVYGKAVRALRITELTARAYREELVRDAPILGPGPERWNRGGMHHVDPHRLGDGRWLASVDGWFAAGTTGAGE